MNPASTLQQSLWKRLSLLVLSAIAIQCILVFFPPASHSERLHLTLPVVWLIDFLYYQRPYIKMRWSLVISAIVVIFAFLSLLIWGQARTLEGRLNPLEPLWWFVFVSSLGVLYNLLHTGLTQLCKLHPTARVLMTQPKGWWLRLLRQSVAIIIFSPYLFTATNIHRFKIANATNPQQSLHLQYESVQFQAAEDGVILSGWFIPRRHSDKAVLLCHGIGANKGNFLPFVPFLHEAGFNVFIFDFRGHGDSAGHTISFGYYEARDVRGAINYLRQRPEIKHIMAYAFSMGGSSLLHAIPDLPEIKGVVVDSTFADLTMVAQHHMSILPLGLGRFMVQAIGLYTPIELGIPLSAISSSHHIAGIRPRPLLIIHGRADSLIPSRQAEINFDAAREPKQLWLVPDANHIETMGVAGDEYQQRVVRFLKRCVVP